MKAKRFGSAAGHLDVTHCKFASEVQQPEQSHCSTDLKSEQVYGAHAPHVAPAHGAEHAEGVGGGDRGIGCGGGGGGEPAWPGCMQQPVQSHDRIVETVLQSVCRKSEQNPAPHGLEHCGGIGSGGGGGAYAAPGVERQLPATVSRIDWNSASVNCLPFVPPHMR